MPMLSERVEESLDPVISRWAGQEKEILRPLFRQIETGKSIWDTGLAERLHRTTGELEQALDASLAELDSGGRVAELFGITREPTAHRIDVDGKTLFSCCALVAHTVPAILGQAATVISADPVSGNKIRIRISAELELQDADPQASVGSLVDCEPGDLLEDPRSKFCCHVKHFTSATSAAEFCGEDSRRYPVPIDEFHAGALHLFQHIWA
jgi:alkylmercury lyase